MGESPRSAARPRSGAGNTKICLAFATDLEGEPGYELVDGSCAKRPVVPRVQTPTNANHALKDLMLHLLSASSSVVRRSFAWIGNNDRLNALTQLHQR